MELIDSYISNYFNATETIPDIKPDIIIGIDLGTCNSCCSVWRNNKYEIIPDENGNHVFPSIIVFDEHDNIYSCNTARDYINNHPSSQNFFYESKRLIGRKYTDKIIENEREYLTYKIQSDEQDNILIVKNMNNEYTKTLTPEEISSYVLSSIKLSAEKYLKQEVKKAVITVPAYFNDNQRQATKDAASIAGLECVMILCEPIASALAYGLNNIRKDNYKILVYDLGGGTLDVSLIELNDGIFEVLGTSGNMHLGGIDFDNIIYSYCMKVFAMNNKINNHSKINKFISTLDNEKKKTLIKLCETAKQELSFNENSIINITNFWNEKNLNINLSRTKFIELCNRLLHLSIQPINDLMHNININKQDIDEVIMVGGMTRIPIMQSNIEDYFNKKPNTSVNPDEIVAIGAGIQAFIIANPTDKFSESITLLNTTTLSIGIEVSNNIMDVLIPKNSLIPICESREYTNNESDEKSIVIKIYEGERQLTSDNYFVGEFEIDVEPAPRCFHKIEIRVNINIDNIISVSAKNLRDNTVKEIIINGKNGRLTKEQIDNMIRDSKKYKLIDKQNKKCKKLQNELKGLVNIIKYNIVNDKVILSDIEYNEENTEEYNNYIKDNELKKTELLKSVNDIDLMNTNIIELKALIKKMQEMHCMIITKDDGSKKSLSGLIEKTKNIGITGTSIYQDETIDEEYNACTNMINQTEHDVNIITDTDEIRKNTGDLLNKCDNILDYVNSLDIDMCEELTSKLKEYIEDIIIQVHTKNKISLEYCLSKITQVNEMYNEYIANIQKIELSLKDELIILCNSLKKSVLANIDINENKKYKELSDLIEITEIEVNSERLISDDEYINYIEEINNLCDIIDKS